MLPPSWILKKRKTDESEAKSDDGQGGLGLHLTSVITDVFSDIISKIQVTQPALKQAVKSDRKPPPPREMCPVPASHSNY